MTENQSQSHLSHQEDHTLYMDIYTIWTCMDVSLNSRQEDFTTHIDIFDMDVPYGAILTQGINSKSLIKKKSLGFPYRSKKPK